MRTTRQGKNTALPRPGENTATDEGVLAQLAALQHMSVNELKIKWEALLGTTAPNNARAFLELRISHRIQELTYGGLSAVAKAITGVNWNGFRFFRLDKRLGHHRGSEP